jgi:hypothetical protein
LATPRFARHGLRLSELSWASRFTIATDLCPAHISRRCFYTFKEPLGLF